MFRTKSPRAWKALCITSVLSFVCAAPLPAASAESAASAIARIRKGPHVAVPPPQRVQTSGPVGKGMTVENHTEFTLRVYFNGPVSRTIDVPSGQSAGVELVVGSYEVAAETPEGSVIPLYGMHTYSPRAHYWLKFFLSKRSIPQGPGI